LNGGRRYDARALARGLVLCLTLALASLARAEQPHSESAVKAAYLYRFASYVEWPDKSTSGHPFLIDIMGDPDVARELRHLMPGHLINDEPVQVREVTRVEDLDGPQILYVGADHAAFLHALRTSGRPLVLLVTDDDQGLDLGGVLNFVTVDKRVRFEVSLTAAERAHLKISADLLSVAIRVHGGRRQSDELCIPYSLPQDAGAPCGIRQARQVMPVTIQPSAPWHAGA